MVRFIHTADLHLDRSFEGLSRLQGQLPFDGAQMNQQVLTNIVDQALQQQVDFLLLAGDTFHQQRPSLKTQHHLVQEFQRLATAGIPVYLSFGNHDYYDPQRYWFAFPENVQLFSSEIVTTFQGRAKSGETYAISGFSYQRPHLMEEKVAEFPRRSGADVQIGMLHGDSQSAQFAPFSISQLQKKGYDYWALGHIHVPTVLSQQPLIQYPGAPQGHTIKETAAGSVCLVELRHGRATSKSLPVAAVLWQELTLSLQGLREPNEALAALQERLPQADQPLLLRLQLTDTVALPADFQERVRSEELLHYLNEGLIARGSQTRVMELTLATAEAPEKIFLPASEELLAQLLQEVAVPEVFAEIVADLQGQPLVKDWWGTPEFRQETLDRTRASLETTFDWGQGE